MSTGKALSPVEGFRKTVSLMEPELKKALPGHIPSEKFVRTLMTTVQLNPTVLECTQQSVLSAVMQSAQHGLLADGREAAIVKFKDSAQFIPMVAGIMKKVRNSGEITTWSVQVVKENDKFEMKLGDEEKIVHEPALKERGKTIGAYSIVTLKDGEKSREWMDIEEIESIRARSRAKEFGPWKTDYDEMAKKTVIRRHSKRLPMSTDLQETIHAVDELYDMNTEEPKPIAVQSRLEKAIGNVSKKPTEVIPSPTPIEAEIVEEQESPL